MITAITTLMPLLCAAPQERAPAPVLGLFGGTRKIESLATQVERQVESQRTRKGTQAFFLGGRQEEEEEDDPRAAQQKERAEAQARCGAMALYWVVKRM